jgi:Zn-dependent protease with chaperone function
MRCSSSFDVGRQEKAFFRIIPLAVVFCAALSASAQTPIPDADESPTSVAEEKPVVHRINSKIDSKKLAKYDVSLIGQRDIGRGFNMYSLKRERQLGASLASAMDRGTRIVTDPVLNDYVNRVAQKIVRNSDADIPFTVRLIDTGDTPRAYGLPGGYLYVDTALIFSAESEAELAGIMAREIAHVAARHATRALTRKDVWNFTGLFSMMTGPAGVLLGDAGGVAGPLSVKKFSRDAEYEADLLGIEYAYSAGYDPEALLVALEKLHVLELNRSAMYAQIPGYSFFTKIPFHNKIAHSFSSYPQMDERIRRLQAEITTFLPDRKEYIIDTNEFQEIKSRLRELQGPLQLRRHSDGEDGPKGPVLRRAPQQDDVEASTGNLRSLVTALR